MKKERFHVAGITCASCVAIIQRVLKKIDGVQSIEVNPATNQALVEYDETKTNAAEFNAALQEHGYVFHPMDQQHSSHGQDHTAHAIPHREVQEAELRELRPKVAGAFPAAVIIFIGMMSELIFRALGKEFFIPMEWWRAVQLVIATPVLFWSGDRFIKAIWIFAKTRMANMDSLIGIGTSVAYLYSFFIFVLPAVRERIGLSEDVYFDATIVVIGFVLFGKYLESRSKMKAGEAIEALLQLQATVAHVKRGGEIVDVPLDQVRVDDICVVKAGEKIPADGEIMEGQTHVDESMITGESMPVGRGGGDAVIGATMNKEGIITVRVKQVGSESALAQIITLVQEAQSSKAPIQKFADTISAYFVPIVLVLSVIVFVLWITLGSRVLEGAGGEALPIAISALVGILVIACPCALGLATPTAIVVSTGTAARNGILIKNAESLEQAHRVNTVLFDKTGTLTQGKPTVTDIIPFGTIKKDELLQYAASVEQFSEHPLGIAVLNYAKQNACPIAEVRDTQVIEGAGIEAISGEHRWAVGGPAYLRDRNIHLSAEQLSSTEQLSQQAKTVIFVVRDNALVGLLALADVIKPEAIDAVAALQRHGIKTVMITGDNATSAKAIAGQLHIDEVLAEVRPAQKAEKVKELQQAGSVVAMVGDGINDAPALAQADIGIAMSTGTDVAIESADITLLHGDIRKVSAALQLSKRTIRVIKQNLFWAFFYNVVGIPIAAGVLYPFFGVMLNPAVAGIAMACSSVSVLTNSLRLRKT